MDDLDNIEFDVIDAQCPQFVHLKHIPYFLNLSYLLAVGVIGALLQQFLAHGILVLMIPHFINNRMHRLLDIVWYVNES